MKISVIVPIYNMEHFILQTIKCLKEQDEKNIEFILINDGSTDNSLKIIKSLCSEDKRFRIFDINNRGYGHACNLGIKYSTGDFWAIYEPDDYVSHDFYSFLKNIAERYPQADVIKYNGIYITENNTAKRLLYNWEQKYTEKVIDKYTLKRFWRSHPSVFNAIYRKDFTIQKKIYFCETPGASFQDAMFMVSLFYANPSLYIANTAKYTYVKHTLQSINFIDNKVDFIITAWKKEAEWLSQNGFRDYDFFLYRVFSQMENILKKVSPENKKRLKQSFKKLNRGYRFLNTNIPTLKEKIRYIVS